MDASAKRVGAAAVANGGGAPFGATLWQEIANRQRRMNPIQRFMIFVLAMGIQSVRGERLGQSMMYRH